MKLLKNIAMLAAFSVPAADAATWFVRMDRLEVYNSQKLGAQDIYIYTITNRDGSSGTNTTTPDNPQTTANAIYDDVTGRIAWLGTIKTSLIAGGHYINWTDGALQVQGGNLTAGTWACVETDGNKACTDPDPKKRLDQVDYTFDGAYARLDSPATNALLKLATADFVNIETAIANDETPTAAQDDLYYFQMTFKITGPAGIASGNIPDTDGDGLLDNVDNCPSISNNNQLDTDGDDAGDICDSDDDADTVADDSDNCPLISNTDQQDSDSDGTGDACEVGNDLDNDQITDSEDNCPLIANNDQKDADKDGEGNVCDSDDDGDTVVDGSDNCPLNANQNQADLNSDGVGDVCGDADSDGVKDLKDNCPLNANSSQYDKDSDGQGNACDSDDDNDGVSDVNDNCQFVANVSQSDLDGDSKGDACDSDKDGDGLSNAKDKFPLDDESPIKFSAKVTEKVSFGNCGDRELVSKGKMQFISERFYMDLERSVFQKLYLSGKYGKSSSGSVYKVMLDSASRVALEKALEAWSMTTCTSGVNLANSFKTDFSIRTNKDGKGKLSGKVKFTGRRNADGVYVRGDYTFDSDIKLPK